MGLLVDIFTNSLLSIFLGFLFALGGVILLFLAIQGWYKNRTFTPLSYVAGAVVFCFFLYQSILICGAFACKSSGDEIEARINEIRRNWLYYKLRKELSQQDPALAADSVALDSQVAIMLEDTLAAMGPYVIPADRRAIYKTIGGVPHLDGSVTIFGEVVEGFDVVEKVTLMKTDKNDRPLTDVIIKGTKVFQR